MQSRPVAGAAAGVAAALCVVLLTGTVAAGPRADDAPGGAASYRPAQGSVYVTGT
ncbi:hypothetical protein [Streptomyces pratensis]|uniref:hypothetical protein n=1 Tax=Streptomyces pratensis TaxID=1169025 RepID=UPI001933600B|nr:hypothetical protein [Streptomyces pratensis]